MKLLISTSAIAAASLFWSPTAKAEQVCMMAGEMKAALIDWYGERPIAAPSDTNEQLWVSERSGTWTMIKTFADGSACVLAQGEDWTTGTGQDDMLALLEE